MWQTETGAPETTTDRDDVQLGIGLCTLDCVGDFLGALGAEAEVAIAIAKGNKCLESKTVTGLGLLLDRVDLEAFFLEAGLGVTVWLSKEVVDDFLLLDRKGVEVNVFKVLDLARFDETSKLGAWGPDLLVSVATTAATAATATSAASAASVASAPQSLPITKLPPANCLSLTTNPIPNLTSITT